MVRSLTRVAVACLFLLSAVASADAALILIDEVQGGGSGTLINDGQADVGSNDGSGDGDALLMSVFGITTGNLAADLAAFTVTGTFTDNEIFNGPAVSATITNLWLVGTLTGTAPFACTGCGLLSDVDLGASGLGFNAAGDTQNVLFLIPLVGEAPGGSPFDPWEGPSNPDPLKASPLSVPIPPATAQFQLTPAQINFIVTRMRIDHSFGAADVHLGLSLEADGVTATGNTNIGSAWDFAGPNAAVPEPATVLLLGTGLVAGGMRRLRRHRAH